MEYKITISGFGGQGVLFLGKVIAEAAIYSGFETSWLPSYGPEMRGGTANCRVVISDSEIVSPAFSCTDGLIAMNLPSLNKFKPTTDGIVVTDAMFDCNDTVGVNTKLAASGAEYDGLTNMIMLGAFIANTKLLSRETVCKGIRKVAGDVKAYIDVSAFEYGYKSFK